MGRFVLLAGLALAIGCKPEPLPPMPTLERPDSDGEVEMVWVGDIMPSRHVERIARKAAGDEFAEHVFAHVAPVLRAADIAAANFECVASRRGQALEKAYTMRTDPSTMSALANAGLDVLSLANNHSLDYGEQALEDTWRATVEAGLLPVGIRFGKEERAQKPAIVRVGNRAIAFLGYTAIFPKSFRDLTPGPFRLNRLQMVRDIRSARKNAAHVVVSLHIGREYSLRPTKQQRDVARIALDAGATVVAQHHTHTPLPIEVDMARGRVAAFGLGNFVFDLNLPWKRYRVHRSEMLRVRMDDRLLEARLEPVLLDKDFRPRMGGDLDPESMTQPYRPAGKILWSLEDALPSAAVERALPEGPIACQEWVDRALGNEHVLDGYFRCSNDLSDAVGRSADISAGRWRSVVRAVPKPSSSVRLEFDDVPLGAKLVGFADLSDWAAQEPRGSPVAIDWATAKGAVTSLVLPNEPGWKEFSAPIPAGFSGKLTVTLSATAGLRRHVGFAAWIVADEREEPPHEGPEEPANPARAVRAPSSTRK